MQKRKTIKALAAPQLFHGAIASSFESLSKHLWRIDTLGDKKYLLITAREAPDLTEAVAQFGNDAKKWEIIPFDPLLDRIHSGDRWHFKLRANPVVCKRETDRCLAHVTVEQQKKWLTDRAEKRGFQLEPEDFTVTASEWLSFKKGTDGGRKVTLRAVTFEGVLTVTNTDQFRETLKNGIGHGKAYGLGMMTVAGRLGKI